MERLQRHLGRPDDKPDVNDEVGAGIKNNLNYSFACLLYFYQKLV